jgi:hypothetical protein
VAETTTICCHFFYVRKVPSAKVRQEPTVSDFVRAPVVIAALSIALTALNPSTVVPRSAAQNEPIGKMSRLWGRASPRKTNPMALIIL